MDIRFMNKMRETIILLFLCVITAAGCGSETSILKAEDTGQTQDVSPTENIEQTKDTGRTEDAGQIQEAGEPENAAPKEESLIYVDVCGAVVSPGVYQLPSGSRIFQAIEMAGGLLEDAADNVVNQAQVLSDGQQVRIYTKEEAGKIDEGKSLITENSIAGTDTGGDSADKTVNINQADKEALMTLTGVGAARAEAILAYRQQHGEFSSVEELMQVEGIKEKTYDKLKDKITVE